MMLSVRAFTLIVCFVGWGVCSALIWVPCSGLWSKDVLDAAVAYEIGSEGYEAEIRDRIGKRRLWGGLAILGLGLAFACIVVLVFKAEAEQDARAVDPRRQG